MSMAMAMAKAGIISNPEAKRAEQQIARTQKQQQLEKQRASKAAHEKRKIAPLEIKVDALYKEANDGTQDLKKWGAYFTARAKLKRLKKKYRIK